VSSIWVSRDEIQGPAFHALIIGVSNYEFFPEATQGFPRRDKVTLGLTKLKTPAAGAFRVARWLRDNYWHPTVQWKTIRLLLSPSDEEKANELAALEKPVPPATAAEVKKALDEWQADCTGNRDGIAFLYAAGHGIRWNLYDSLVLLEDFGTPRRFLNETIDLEKCVESMRGSDLPRTQFYFSDACKVDTDEADSWKRGPQPGTPLAPDPSPSSNALICAPLYCAAYPGQRAIGYRGQGTYFAQGLVECLDGFGWTPPEEAAAAGSPDSYYRITHLELARRLQQRVKAIAKVNGDVQNTTLGGTIPSESSVLCAANGIPKAPFQLTVSPSLAAPEVRADLTDGQGQVITSGLCEPVPLKLSVVVGSHTLDLDVPASAKFSKPRPRPVVVQPFVGWSGEIPLQPK
jgi:hypothetical protein